jgi:hypothetical protein
VRSASVELGASRHFLNRFTVVSFNDLVRLGIQLPYALDDMGEQNVKNIARPVRVYALRPEAVADLPARVCNSRRHAADSPSSS